MKAIQNRETGNIILGNNPTLQKWFRENVIGATIAGFPYPQRYCRFCSRDLVVIDAVHVIKEPELYKAMYLCDNPTCPALDEEAAKQYARIYYSCDEAYKTLEYARIVAKVNRKGESGQNGPKPFGYEDL